MPPRHTYWTIILEGKPTAFRAHTRDELAPTLRQLQSRHPDAVLMWFARGRLWESPEQEARARRQPPRERRGPDWRPGGAHKDPRERFRIPRDEKRRRFAARTQRDTLKPRDGEKADGERPRGPEQDRRRDRHRPRGLKWERPWQRDRPRGPGRERSRQGDRRDDARGSRPGQNRGRRGPRGGGRGGGR